MSVASSQKSNFVYCLGILCRGIDRVHKLVEIAEFLMSLFDAMS